MNEAIPVDKNEASAELDAGLQRLRDVGQHWLTNEQAAAVLAELERLRLSATAAEKDAAADRKRLAYVREFCDNLGDIDLHERACEYATKLGREEANDDDYLAATRDAFDQVITWEMQKP